MTTAVAWSLALRYLATRRRQFAAFITWVSLAGLALGVLVLTVVVSVMNGFDRELKTRILGSVPHVLVSGVSTAEPRAGEILALPGVETGFDFFVGAGMLSRGSAVHPVTLFAFDPEDANARSAIGAHLTAGTPELLQQAPRSLLLGAPLAARLGLLPGDVVALIIPEPAAAGIEVRLEAFRLAGTFEVGAELDYTLAFLALDDVPVPDPAQVGNVGLRLVLDDPLLADSVARALEARFPELAVHSWSDTYGELFDAVRLEKLLMFVILLMVVAVAAFNIVSGQMMVVNDKRADIAILRTMGADDRTILLAFLLQGVLIALIGIGTGIGLGVVTAGYITAIVDLMKAWFGFGLLDGTYLVEVPVLVRWQDLLIIALVSGVISLISSWLPARRAADLDPVQSLGA